MRMSKPAVLPLISAFLSFSVLFVALAGGLCVHASNSAAPFSDDSADIPFLCDENGILTGIDPSWLEDLAATGETTVPLILPSSVNGIPVTGIGPQAFLAERYETLCPGLQFTQLKLPDTGLVSIGEYAFYGYKGPQDVLFLPDSLQTVGSYAFYDASFTTVYLPDSETTYGESSFGGASLRSLICPNQDIYIRLSSQNIVDSPDKLTWILTLQFQDEDGWMLAASREALHHMPLNYLPQQDGSWAAQKDYNLPPLADSSGAYTWFWVFDTEQADPVSPSTLISGNVLTAVKRISPPQITFGEDIHKVYDGTHAVLSVNAFHPLAASVEKAKNGSVIFYYIWTWTDENGNTNEKEGYDLSSLEFTDSCRLSAAVLVRTFAAGNPDSPLDERTHTFHVQISQAEPTVEPEPPINPFLIRDGLPELSLKEGSTPGTLCWVEGQTPLEGVHEYQWLFIPQDSENYTTATGTLLLDGRLYPPSAAYTDIRPSSQATQPSPAESPAQSQEVSAKPAPTSESHETAQNLDASAKGTPKRLLVYFILLSAVLAGLYLLRVKQKKGGN